MVEGKHEASANVIYKVLNNLAEIVNPKDISILIDEACTIKEVDSNILTFIKAIGNNNVFDVTMIKHKIYIEIRKKPIEKVKDLVEQWKQY